MDLAGGLSRCQPDNCEKILAAALASRYFSIQFFASLEKWIGARNPVRIGSSCAAVTGYDFPMGQSSKVFGGEGGKKVRAAQASYARSQNIWPVHLIRPANAGRKNFFAKRRMRAGRCGLGHTSPTLGVGGNLYAKSPSLVFNSQFDARGARNSWAGRRKIDTHG